MRWPARWGQWLVTYALFGFLAGTACTPRPQQAGWSGWVRQPLQHARFFQLWAQGNARLLVTFGSGGGQDTTGLFVLGAPEAASLPSGAVRMGQPLARVALMSTTHASFISALGLAGSVKGCAYTDRLRDSAVVALASAGKVEEVGAGEGMNREKVLMLAPDAVFTYPYGTQGRYPGPGKIAVVPVAEYLEEHPLGRAEWIRAFGMLFGVEARADSLYKAIAARYEKIKAAVPVGNTGPVVFFGSAWKGAWSVPAGNSYMACMIQDAGGRYLFSGSQAGGNLDVGLERVLQAGAAADYWGRILDQSGPVSAMDIAGGDRRIRALRAFTGHGGFYANSAESDLFGRAALEPDVVLQDLVGIFRPAQAKGRSPVYFKPVQ